MWSGNVAASLTLCPVAPRAISDTLVRVVGEVVRPHPPVMVATVVYIVLPQQCVGKQNTFFAGLCLGPNLYVTHLRCHGPNVNDKLYVVILL